MYAVRAGLVDNMENQTIVEGVNGLILIMINKQ